MLHYLSFRSSNVSKSEGGDYTSESINLFSRKKIFLARICLNIRVELRRYLQVFELFDVKLNWLASLDFRTKGAC